MTTDIYGPYNLSSERVIKKALESTGKKFHRDQWYDAPNDSYFVEDSWGVSILEMNGSKNLGIRICDFKKTKVEVTLPNGEKVTHQFVTSFLASVHVEIDSGKTLSDISAWIEGEIFAETQKYR